MIDMERFYDNMTAILNALLSWASQLTTFISHNLLLSFVFAFFIMKMLMSFYKKIKHIF